LFRLILVHGHTSVCICIIIIIIIIIIIEGFGTQGETIEKVVETDTYKCLGILQSRRGVFKLYLLKDHNLPVERFAGRMQVLVSKFFMLLPDIPTNISLHKHTQDSFLLFPCDLWATYYLLIPTGIFLGKECSGYANSE
jgi:hypothetical protein